MSDRKPPAPGWWEDENGGWHPPAGKVGKDMGEGQSKSRVGMGCLVVFVIAVALATLGSIFGGDSGDDEPAGQELEWGAFDVCTQFVKDRLRAPGTASFPNQHEDDGEVVITGGPSEFTVRSHADAENGFGGEVRTAFVCTVRHAGGDNYRLVDLSLD